MTFYYDFGNEKPFEYEVDWLDVVPAIEDIVCCEFNVKNTPRTKCLIWNLIDDVAHKTDEFAEHYRRELTEYFKEQAWENKI